LEDFEAKVPVVEKKDLRIAQLHRSATIFAYRNRRSSIFTAPAAPRVGRRRSRIAATTGARSPTRMLASYGGRVCGPATRSALRQSSRSTWEVGARSPERSGSVTRYFPFGAGVAGMSACSGLTYSQTDRVLWHPDLRASSSTGGGRGGTQSARLQAQDHVLFRRAWPR
jgi:hypothetical protein